MPGLVNFGAFMTDDERYHPLISIEAKQENGAQAILNFYADIGFNSLRECRQACEVIQAILANGDKAKVKYNKEFLDG